jgi:hypothetical protein
LLGICYFVIIQGVAGVATSSWASVILTKITVMLLLLATPNNNHIMQGCRNMIKDIKLGLYRRFRLFYPKRLEPSVFLHTTKDKQKGYFTAGVFDWIE